MKLSFVDAIYESNLRGIGKAVSFDEKDEEKDDAGDDEMVGEVPLRRIVFSWK